MEKKKKYIYNINKHAFKHASHHFFYWWLPVSFNLKFRVFVGFESGPNIYKYIAILLNTLILIYFFYRVFILKNQIICLNCLYLDE